MLGWWKEEPFQELGGTELFMAKVEECVGDDTFVADVFRGQQTYETTCSECHNVTERAADFDELEVALRGQSSVGDCVRCRSAHESPRRRGHPKHGSIRAQVPLQPRVARGRQPVPLRAMRQKGRRRAATEKTYPPAPRPAHHPPSSVQTFARVAEDAATEFLFVRADTIQTWVVHHPSPPRPASHRWITRSTASSLS